jgi:hypothetical protein
MKSSPGVTGFRSFLRCGYTGGRRDMPHSGEQAGGQPKPPLVLKHKLCHLGRALRSRFSGAFAQGNYLKRGRG